MRAIPHERDFGSLMNGHQAKTLGVKDKEKDDKAADGAEEEILPAPSPLLDLSDAAVKKMIKQARSAAS